VVFQTNLHSAVFLPPAMAALLALVLVPVALATSTRSLPVTGALAAIILTLLGWSFRRSLTALESRLAAIERVEVDPGILGGALGYGTIYLMEVGGRPKGKLPYVAAPEQLQASVEQQKQVAKKPAKGLDISERQVGAVTIVELSGRVVYERSAELEEKLSSLITSGRTKLVVDGNQVKAIDSAGIGALARGYREAAEHGGRLVIAAPSSRVSEALGLIRIPIQMFSSLDEAIGSFG
jgi:anti-anti-sigma factor